MQPTHLLELADLLSSDVTYDLICRKPMRNNLILVGLIIIGLGLWFFSLKGRDQSSVALEDIEFAVKDTASVYTIHLSQYQKGEVSQSLALFRTKEGTWSLNDQYTAFQPRIDQLLKVMHLLRVKELLAPKGQATAERLLADAHLKVEAFDRDGKSIRVYFIGTPAKNGQGNLMKLEDADMPVIVEMPGLQGFVSNFFSLEPLFWRENLLFDGRLDALESVSVQYRDGRSSFALKRNLNGIDWDFVNDSRKPDPVALARYLEQFQGKVYAESFAFENYPSLFEELSVRPSEIALTVTNRDGTERQLYLYKRDDNPNNYFGWLEGANELLTIQTYVIDKYLVSLED
ncbi:MAG: hypothetical protein AAFQ87_06565, partial [Bacteroidota bacterium]